MRNETANKIAFLMLAILLTFLLSWMVDSSDLFCTIILALIVGVFCWDLEKNFELLKKQNHPKNSEPIRESESVSKDKIGAYVLNLSRAKERWKFIHPQVKNLKIPYERIEAVDGSKLSDEFKKEIVDEKVYVKLFKMLPESGTIGCSLSHEKAWKKFLESDNEFALIFEDDVKFDPPKLHKVILSAIQHKDLWDVLSFESNHHGYPQKIAKLTSDEDEFLVFYMTSVKHAGAYLIGREAAKKLLERFYPIKMPLDHYYSRSWELGLRFCGVEPRIVEQKFGDTQIKDEKAEKIDDLKTLAANVGYHIYTESMRSAYNALLYLASRRKV